VLVAAAAVVAGALLTACGLPKDGAPRALAKRDVPFSLLASSTTSVPAGTPQGTVTVHLFFLQGPHLQSVNREVRTSGADEVLTSLLGGVTETDGEVRSDIPKGTQLVKTTRQGNVLVIELTPEITASAQGPIQKNAFAQIVYTADQLNGVFGVRFKVHGEYVKVPTDNGASDAPVFPVDFDSVAPQ
jgi:hypothetical protein